MSSSGPLRRMLSQSNRGESRCSGVLNACMHFPQSTGLVGLAVAENPHEVCPSCSVFSVSVTKAFCYVFA